MNEVLSPKEQRVIRMRYGLDDGTMRSQQEIAATLGIARQTVAKVCNKAYRKLKDTEAGEALFGYME